jgi:hypothetical protein
VKLRLEPGDGIVSHFGTNIYLSIRIQCDTWCTLKLHRQALPVEGTHYALSKITFQRNLKSHKWARDLIETHKKTWRNFVRVDETN